MPRDASDLFIRLAPFGFIALWSSSFVAARVGLEDMSPLLFVALRLLGATALLLALSAALRQSWAGLRGRWWYLALAGALVNGVALGAFHVGLVTVNAATIALMQSLSPLLIALLAIPLLRERLGARAWFGLVLGTVGVAVVVAPRVVGTAAELNAVLLGGLGVCGLAGGTLVYGRHGRGLPLLQATAVQLGAAGVLVLLAMALFEAPRAAWTAAAVASVIWNVLAVSIGGMALYYFMLNRGAAGRVAANFYLVPGVVALLSWGLLGEALAPAAVAGLVVASVGVFLVARR